VGETHLIISIFFIGIIAIAALAIAIVNSNKL
jgi:hypothetical protein